MTSPKVGHRRRVHATLAVADSDLVRQDFVFREKRAKSRAIASHRLENGMVPGNVERYSRDLIAAVVVIRQAIERFLRSRIVEQSQQSQEVRLSRVVLTSDHGHFG